MKVDKLANVRGQKIDIKRKKRDCTTCDFMQRIGEYAWVVEVLTTKAGITGEELSSLFAEAHRAVSGVIVPRD